MRCLLLAAAVGAALTGCAPKEIGQPGGLNAPQPDLAPSRSEIAAAQNTRVASVTRYWSSAALDLRWIEEDGNKRHETGDGYLMLQPPHRTALIFNKLGETYLWAGSDDEHVWLFEAGDADLARIARVENVFHPLSEPMPLSVHPLEVLDLLGMTPLNDFAGPDPLWSRDFAGWIIEEDGPTNRRRLYFEHETLLPKRVELSDPLSGEVLVSADLFDYRPVDQEGRPPGLWPLMPTRFVLRPADEEEGYVSVTVREPRDRNARGRWDANAFNPGAIAQVMRPSEWIILDERCPEPAQIP